MVVRNQFIIVQNRVIASLYDMSFASLCDRYLTSFGDRG